MVAKTQGEIVDEVKLKAMIFELEQQRNVLGTRCAEMAAELATTLQQVKTLQQALEKKDEPEIPSPADG